MILRAAGYGLGLTPAANGVADRGDAWARQVAS